MRRLRPTEKAGGFEVLAGTERSQAATMVLGAGEKTGGPNNRHPGSDQWLYVVAGRGEVAVSGETFALEPGILVLIEAGETHEVRSDETGDLVTMNVYAPPAY